MEKVKVFALFCLRSESNALQVYSRILDGILQLSVGIFIDTQLFLNAKKWLLPLLSSEVFSIDSQIHSHYTWGSNHIHKDRILSQSRLGSFSHSAATSECPRISQLEHELHRLQTETI